MPEQYVLNTAGADFWNGLLEKHSNTLHADAFLIDKRNLYQLIIDNMVIFNVEFIYDFYRFFLMHYGPLEIKHQMTNLLKQIVAILFHDDIFRDAKGNTEELKNSRKNHLHKITDYFFSTNKETEPNKIKETERDLIAEFNNEVIKKINSDYSKLLAELLLTLYNYSYTLKARLATLDKSALNIIYDKNLKDHEQTLSLFIEKLNIFIGAKMPYLSIQRSCFKKISDLFTEKELEDYKTDIENLIHEFMIEQYLHLDKYLEVQKPLKSFIQDKSLLLSAIARTMFAIKLYNDTTQDIFDQALKDFKIDLSHCYLHSYAFNLLLTQKNNNPENQDTKKFLENLKTQLLKIISNESGTANRHAYFAKAGNRSDPGNRSRNSKNQLINEHEDPPKKASSKRNLLSYFKGKKPEPAEPEYASNPNSSQVSLIYYPNK